MGSASSVNDSLPWQQRMNEWLRGCFEQRIPVFGICYGHQLIAHLFGGKVDYHSPDRSKNLGFRKVILAPNPLWGNEKLEGSLFVSHCEMVVECPSELIVTASSPQVPVEGLMHGQLPIWSFQPHPEAGPHFAVRRNLTYTTHEEAFSFGHRLVKAFLEYCHREGADKR